MGVLESFCSQEGGAKEPLIKIACEGELGAATQAWTAGPAVLVLPCTSLTFPDP